jgi:hypothetical protein
MNTEIARLERPDIQDYEDAFQVCEEVWPYLAALNSRTRFSMFRQLGIELVIAKRSGRTVGACFILPERYCAPAGQPADFVWLFDFAVAPEGRGAGASILVKATKWYKNLMAVGVTGAAAALYEGLKWKRFDGLWRCVHPLDVRGFLKTHLNGQPHAALSAIRATAPLYQALSAVVECAARRAGAGACLRTGEEAKSALDDARFRAAAQYLPSAYVSTGNGELVGILRAGVGRILVDGIRGLSRLRAHLLLWAYLRAGGAYVCEYLTASRPVAALAPLLGYLPIRMPLYYHDVNGSLAPYIASLPTRQFNFCGCDKIL